MTVLKNPFEIGRDEKFLHESAAEHGVFDFIADDGAVVLLDKRMFVHPERVGAFALTIDEAMRRLPDRDFALPTQRNAAQAQAIIEQRPFFNRDIGARQYFETKPGRREPLEIARVGKKIEDLIACLREPELGFKLISFHSQLHLRVRQSLDVIAQHELLRARCQVYLSSEIIHIVFLNVMVHQSDRHNERHQLSAEVADQIHQLATLSRR